MKQKEIEVSILGAILGKRESAVGYRTIDGGHPAPYPDMTDEQLYNYEITFNVPKKTFDRPPVSARTSHVETRTAGTGRYTASAHASAAAHAEPDLDKTRQLNEARHTESPARDTGLNDSISHPESKRESQWQSDTTAASVAHPEVAPLDLTKPVRTVTTKQPVEIVTTKARHPIYKVHGYIGDDSVMTVFTLDGRLSENGARFLENLPEQKHLHLNIYANPDPHAKERYLLTQHETAEEAETSAKEHRITCVKVQFDL
ncbi:hypothetical protein [Noviherbaspirillum sp.]|uniref:hypothetical protein n=1 Tax=Noviherbaspirillum sp. TaxID=1926288 RepID=UPI002FE3DBB3